MALVKAASVLGACAALACTHGCDGPLRQRPVAEPAERGPARSVEPWVVSSSSPPSAPPVEPAPARPVAPCFGGPGLPGAGAITPRLTASRVSGVAPLAVFFETRGTAATTTARPFHELSYCWDFGDPDAGAFTTTGLPKNQARGPSAGHVFERPGRYVISLSVRDSAGHQAATTVTVDVQDPERVFAGAATTCMANGDDFTGCPLGAKRLKGNSLGALAPHVSAGRRLLLARGGEFTGKLEINVPGPGHIGAFGPENKPRPRIVMNGGVFRFSDKEPNFGDFRVSDLDVVGKPTEATIIDVGGRAKDLLVLRVKGSQMAEAVEAPDSIIDYWNGSGHPGHDVIDGLTIADCEMRAITGGGGKNISYIAAHRLLMLGNVYNDSTGGEHVLRTPWIDRGVLSSNDFGHAPKGRHVLKLHAPGFARSGIGRGKYTEELVISDNVLRCTGGHDWCVALGPQNDAADERMRNVVVERNRFLVGPDAQLALVVWAQDVTVRDNLFNAGARGVCVSGGRRGIEPPTARVALLHNTCFSEGEKAALANFDPVATELSAFNNLIAGPHAAGRTLPAKFKQGGNLFTSAPGLAKLPPQSAADFALLPGSPAIDKALGEHASTWDFIGNARPVDGDGSGTAEPDVGAMERAAAAPH
jgi:hypothetical protein